MKHARDDYDRIQDPAELIPQDEPVFLLRAQDMLAAETVKFYAQLTLDHGGDPEIAKAAFEHAQKMLKWPKRKMADLPKFTSTVAEEEDEEVDDEFGDDEVEEPKAKTKAKKKKK